MFYQGGRGGGIVSFEAFVGQQLLSVGVTRWWSQYSVEHETSCDYRICLQLLRTFRKVIFIDLVFLEGTERLGSF